MGGACCTARDRDDFLQQLASSKETDDVWVGVCNIRGTRMLAKRTFEPNELILEDMPIALHSSRREAAWLAAARKELESVDAERAWQFLLAAHCLTAADLPLLRPAGMRPLTGEAGAKVMELKEDGLAINEESSSLSMITARHILQTSGEAGNDTDDQVESLARRVNAIAARISSHGFQVEDRLTAPPAVICAVFYLASFVNTCSAGAHTATWEFDRKKQVLRVRATRMVGTGGEVTFDPASRPWLGQKAKPGSTCVCTSCRTARSRGQPEVSEGVGVASDTGFNATQAASPRHVASGAAPKRGANEESADSRAATPTGVTAQEAAKRNKMEAVVRGWGAGYVSDGAADPAGKHCKVDGALRDSPPIG
mmetsp:Transcript_44107/g.127308  ORF Transcript_44107/g.127308 Transcript_44107/m.127308 type:complete len:368 (-) Transcript_44107:188-1291(-)|eukprot:CAMPEP_0176081668 /NCGR_PEP_ID=MMETSP0120_2-20121206/40851_1 /TAXON_ID=160619 /ORGANISM="Kryptoperidinium foliaceum, Strain CCMP 1326" /LENGTH=367 /DNA_ID=CAMNT_0017415435 /DNA_START=52 /DNA_END=1155 /DNA_ORIENTATION=+